MSGAVAVSTLESRKAKEVLMFHTIVWATDGSETADRALPYVKALARIDAAAVIVVHSREMFVGRASGFPVLADERELVEKIRGQVDAMCEEGLDARFRLV